MQTRSNKRRKMNSFYSPIKETNKMNYKSSSPSSVNTSDLDMDPYIPTPFPNKKFKTDDVVPYVYDKYGRPLFEDEGFTIRFVECGLDRYGRYVGSRYGLSVFDQLSYMEIDTILKRINNTA